MWKPGLINWQIVQDAAKLFYVQEAIVEYLDDLEDLYLAEHELEEIRAGRAKTTPLAEVMKRYGVED